MNPPDIAKWEARARDSIDAYILSWANDAKHTADVNDDISNDEFLAMVGRELIRKGVSLQQQYGEQPTNGTENT